LVTIHEVHSDGVANLAGCLNRVHTAAMSSTTFDITRIGPIAHDRSELTPIPAFTIIGPCPI
jgi:hypothetical protein